MCVQLIKQKLEHLIIFHRVIPEIWGGYHSTLNSVYFLEKVGLGDKTKANSPHVEPGPKGEGTVRGDVSEWS